MGSGAGGPLPDRPLPRAACCCKLQAPSTLTLFLLYTLPRRSFTTIIGPNGSGKSNVMDSISFVLGVRTAQLRGNLKELLYHNSEGQSAEDRSVLLAQPGLLRGWLLPALMGCAYRALGVG